LVEGGVNFLHDLIQAQVVDQMFITRVDVDGDAFEFDEDHLNLHYRLVSSEVINTSTFETWEPIGQEFSR
jgi:dihydrofolate reductase